jgi:hypothetical protein
VLLTALLCTEEFGRVPFDRIRMGRHIAQCAGSSGYRPGDRVKDLFRGLPPLIHCIGRKPWERAEEQSWGINLASDVSAYVLAARGVARDMGMAPKWIPARTWLGGMFRLAAGGHPALAGFPLAVPHAVIRKIKTMGDRRPGS